MNLSARLETGDRAVEAAVHDVSQGGARINAVKGLGVGDQIALTFLGMNAIAGEIVRGGSQFGACFTSAACGRRNCAT